MKKPFFSAATATTLLLPLLFLGAASAFDLPDMPPLKEGLWKIHSITTDQGNPPDETTFYLCRNHAYDNSSRELLKKTMPSCTTVSDTKLPGKRLTTMSCKTSGTTIVSRSTITSVSGTYYRSDSTTTYTPPLAGLTQTSSMQEQTWTGACPANMQPGDRQLANGTIQHRR